jgi:hypothetical protein
LSFVEPVPRTKRHRAVFDLTVTGTEPVELRLFLKKNKQAFSETWLYQFVRTSLAPAKASAYGRTGQRGGLLHTPAAGGLG